MLSFNFAPSKLKSWLRHWIESNILRHTLAEPLKKSLSHNIENHRVQTRAIVQVGCRDWSLFDKS